MDTPGLTIYNVPTMQPRWDRVGVFYVTFAALWTAIVVAGMSFCWYNRHHPIMRIRALHLSFSGIILLHVYWVLAQIVYPIGATMPILIAYDVQYFVMGIWFPLGIALFHAANLRFLRVAKLQRRFTHPELRRIRGGDGRKSSSWIGRFRNMEYDRKVSVFITIGVVIQTLLCVGMWLLCKKYHPSFGVAGTDIHGATLPEQLLDLGRGWEWWPSVVWQFIWAWGVAPYLIWRAWDIRDTMGWRTQTIGACLSGLHATPLFLIASYSTVFDKINMYFAPTQWIQLNTMFIEIFIIFVPAYQLIRCWHTARRVAYSNEKWELQSQASTVRVNAALPAADKGVPSTSTTTFELVEKDQIFGYINATYGDRLFTLTALNRVLDEHPTPLQEFSAYHDFSGENIAFLTSVARWKNEWFRTLEIGEEGRIDMFNAALRIYIDFISPRDAEFPLNLSSGQLRALEDIFEASARTVCGDGNVILDPALPFATPLPPPSRASQDSDGSREVLRPRFTGEVSRLFGLYVFDDVQRHIKQLVLTNTWPKFVKEMQMKRRRSEESVRSGGSGGSEDSEATVVSRVTRFVRSLS